jgi:hypothetical protein
MLMLIGATWYVAFAVSSTSGPFGIFRVVREQLPLGGLTGCVVCLAPWTAGALVLVAATPLWPGVWLFGIAGWALMLGAYTGAKHIVE